MPIDSYNFSYAEKQKRKKSIFVAIITIIIVFIVLQVVFMFVLQPFQITSTAMSPEFNVGDIAFLAPLINGKTLYSSTSSLQRGSIITIDNKTIAEKTLLESTIDFIVGALTFQQVKPFESMRWGDSEVYRIIGFPGDTLYIDNYVAYIREGGASHFLTEFELSNIEYDVVSTGYPEAWNMSVGTQGVTSNITLKKDEYFVLCDNRVVATDSRIFGVVTTDNMSAKVVCRYFPINSIRVFK